LLLCWAEQDLFLASKVTDCCTDHRDPNRNWHSLRSLITLGYEDLRDHTQLGRDTLMARFSEKGRKCSTPLEGKSTLNRLEHVPSQGRSRYHKIDKTPRPCNPSW